MKTPFLTENTSKMAINMDSKLFGDGSILEILQENKKIWTYLLGDDWLNFFMMFHVIFTNKAIIWRFPIPGGEETFCSGGYLWHDSALLMCITSWIIIIIMVEMKLRPQHHYYSIPDISVYMVVPCFSLPIWVWFAIYSSWLIFWTYLGGPLN